MPEYGRFAKIPFSSAGFVHIADTKEFLKGGSLYERENIFWTRQKKTRGSRKNVPAGLHAPDKLSTVWKKFEERGCIMYLSESLVVQALRKEYDSWIRSLTAKEKHAIRKYSYNSVDKYPNRFCQLPTAKAVGLR